MPVLNPKSFTSPTTSVRKIRPGSLLSVLGSPWYAGLILVLWMVAMACATVYESEHGTPAALESFYRSWWFEALLWMLAVNTISSIIVKYPYKKTQVGFLLAHVAILIILAGALITDRWAIRGQIGLLEGETSDQFSIPGQEALTITAGSPAEKISLQLDPDADHKLRTLPSGKLDDLNIHILKYVPDSELVTEVVNDSTTPQAAVEVVLSGHANRPPLWLFEDETRATGPLKMRLRSVHTDAELANLLAPPTSQPTAETTIRIEREGESFEVSLDDAQNTAVALGTTGCTIRVLHYFPNAIVGENGEVTNAPDRPANPYIEAEVICPGGSERHVAFARFPDFQSIHGDKPIGKTKVTLVSPPAQAKRPPIEIITGPNERLHARFAQGDDKWLSQELAIASPTTTPWPGIELTVLQRLDHAKRIHHTVPIEVATDGTTNTPALLLRLTRPNEESREIWIQRYSGATIDVGDKGYELVYSNQIMPLGFNLTLERAGIERYPGMEMVRSYESQVTISDKQTGRERSHVISMNHPVTYRGYTLLQSDLQEGKKQNLSVLAVTRDPGYYIAFTGYLTMLAGMIVVLVNRLRRQKETA